MREAPTKRREAVADHNWFDWIMAGLSAWLLVQLGRNNSPFRPGVVSAHRSI